MHTRGPSYTRTTILFPRRAHEVLLGMKKRGLGAGWWNGFGGKLEPGESYEEAAIRETKEESGLVPSSLRLVAQLEFYFDDTLGVVSHVYTSTQLMGTIQETDEMRPQWFSQDFLPLEHMWPGDRIWVPRVLDANDGHVLGMRLMYSAAHELMSWEKVPVTALRR